MTWALAAALFSGSSLSFAWLAIPHARSADVLGVSLTALSSWALAALLLVLPARHTTGRVLNAVMALVTVNISLAIYFTHSVDSSFNLFYVWELPYAFFFFTSRQAFLQTAWVALCYLAVLFFESVGGEPAGTLNSRDVSQWVIVVGTLTIVGLLVRRLSQWARESEARFRRGFDSSPLGMSLVGTDMRLLDVNDAFCRITGRTREELIGRPHADITHPDDRYLVQREADLVRPGGEGHSRIEKRVLRPDGEVVDVVCHAAVVRSLAGRPLYVFSQMEDVTLRHRQQRDLARGAARSEAVTRLAEIALREEDLGDLGGEVVRTVAATLEADMCAAFRLSPDGEQLVAEHVWGDGRLLDQCLVNAPGSFASSVLMSGDVLAIEDFSDDGRFDPPSALTDHGVVSGISVTVAGRDRPHGILGAYSRRPHTFPVADTNFLHAVGNLLASAIDRHMGEEATRHAAMHDPLTGLPNRTLVLDRIDHALRQLDREEQDLAVLVFDLDRFKVINDSLGHRAGDEVLLALAPRLEEVLRPGDTVGRLGGDEFVVVCEGAGGARGATALAERLSDAIRRPLVTRSGEHVVTASIGIVMATGHGETPESLLRDADAAMYRAKERGRGRFEIFDEGMRAQVLGRLRIETELRRALDRDELIVHYQPVVDVESQRPVSVEALVRWPQPGGELMSPEEFIPVAEETGLIADLGLWVLNRACTEVSSWQREFDIPLGLGVNASGRQFADPVFPADVAEIARQSGLEPGTLGLEVTESVLLEEADWSLTVLDRLREHGLRLLLDDFGTGYSSLTYLKQFPLDALKVDQSFVRGLGIDPDDSAIVEAVIRLGRALGLDVVAEGVETPRQLALLRRLACRRAQGFLFTRPLAAEDLRGFLAENVAA
jgi:diguanylate cyclase (GGDEF)-like protein/PAS domain S-box-containing protein